MNEAVVRLNGFADELAKLGARMPELSADALNAAAHGLREDDLPAQMALLTGIRMKAVLFRLRVAQANKAHLEARVIAASTAVPARLYRHGFEVVDAAHNRARIKVDWVSGAKTAPGFINPKGSKYGRPMPLRTKGKNIPARGVRSAFGPSLAALLKAMMGSQLEAAMNARLSQEVVRRIEAALL